ncbi:MAG: hypothetical protein M1819_000592 [Sarea resinae]|nr:MAG: hypothetical protein M1819_000592 [Sarea resinae]
MSTAASPLRQMDDGPDSSPLSTPPPPDSESAQSPAAQPYFDALSHPETDSRSPFGGDVGVAREVNNNNTSATTKSAKNTSTTSQPKKTSRKKDHSNAAADHDNSTTVEGKVKTKKPRSSSTNPNLPRKKQRTSESASSGDTKPSQGTSRQPKITELVGSNFGVPSSKNLSRNGSSEAIHITTSSHPPLPPRSSGQNYDPIRSANVEYSHTAYSAPVSPQPPRSANRASASPSIASLIDPPTVTPLTSAYGFPQIARVTSQDATKSAPISPSTIHVRPASVSVKAPTNPPDEHASSKMDIDDDDKNVCPLPAAPTSKKSSKETTTTNGHSSTAPSPKPPRQKEHPAPRPPGNGLLTSALFGGPTSAPSDSSEIQAPTVILEVTLKGEQNKYINFARMAEERYGFNALHPRIAAQRERLARVAAAGAALEKAAGSGTGSADDMSLDLSEPESNVEMGGTGDGDSTAGGDTKKKPKRRTKVEEYDKDDPFVDDSEMLWEEQAAASKDGFFVYSGPLVPAGEKPTIERADGTVKRGRGRGRGGHAGSSGTTRGSGAGSSGRGGGAAGLGSERGERGTGRGTTTTRKPRVTKAERARMEQEKLEREKMAVLVARGGGGAGAGTYVA